MSTGAREITVREERLRLLPEGALFWEKERLLVVADFHLGKSETFGAHGLALPAAAQAEDLLALAQMGQREGAQNLLLLGDLVHSRKGLTPELELEFARIVKGFPGVATLVAGNHDRALTRNWPASWQEIRVCEEWPKPPFLFRHEPPEKPSRDAPFIWAGHVHPCVSLSGGSDRLRLKAFVVRKNYGLLPAFSSLAGGYEIHPDANTRLYPVSEGNVYELPSH